MNMIHSNTCFKQQVEYFYEYKKGKCMITCFVLLVIHSEKSLFISLGSNWKTRSYNRIIDNCSPSNPSLCLRVPDGVYHHPNGPNKAFIRCFQHRLLEEGICPIEHL